MSTYWFKPKTYGYGGTPVTWEGWTLVVVNVVAVIGCIVLIAIGQHVVLGLLGAFAVTGLVVWLSMIKTDGTWSWRWGNKS